VISIQTRTNQLDFGDHVQESFTDVHEHHCVLLTFHRWRPHGAVFSIKIVVSEKMWHEWKPEAGPNCVYCSNHWHRRPVER